MKKLLLLCLLASAFLFAGCEAVLVSRPPVRYGPVYTSPRIVDDGRYYYRDGRRYDRYDRNYRRDVVVVNRPVVRKREVNVRVDDYRVVKKRNYRDRQEDRYSSDRQRDERNRRKKLEEDRD